MSTTIEHDVKGEERPAGPSDADLLDLVRAGEADAYGQLYVRHEPAATSLARYLTRSKHEADDVVADAFARVLRAIRGGAGPTEAFRPYLLTAVRRTVWRRSDEASHTRLAATEDEAEMLDLRLAVEPEDRTDEGLVLRAFQELPERWQLVLWHTEIEGQPPAEVAPLLGLSPNATAALAVRAREGLRQAYLQAHLQSRPADTCRFSVEHLGSFVRDGLGKRDTAKVEAHLAECDDCRELQNDLGSLNKALRSIVGPAVLGAGAARYLQSAGSAGNGAAVVDSAHRVAHRLRFPHALGVAGAAAALLVTLGLSSDLGRPAPPDTRDTLDASSSTPVVPASSAGVTLVNTALAGTTAAATPGVQADACEGASLPLSLPEGATPTGASLVATDDAGRQPSDVDPAVAARYPQLDSGGAALVGGGGACVSGLLPALADAPPNTALAVTYLDPLGQLHALIVPRIAVTVGNAVQDVNELVDALDQQLQDYLDDITAYLQQTPGGGQNGSSPLGGAGVPDLPDAPPGGVPDLPGIPSVPGTIVGGGSGGGGSGGSSGGGGGSGGVGGAVDDVVDDVDDVLDDVLGGGLP